MFLIATVSLSVIIYVLMLFKDVEKSDFSKYTLDNKGELFVEEATFSETIGEDEILTINVKKMSKADGVLEGEDVSLRLERTDGEVILNVFGKKGNCDFNEARVMFNKGVWGKYGELEWESGNLLWDIKADEIQVRDMVKFKVKGWVGNSSEMIIYPSKKIVAFLGGVRISSHGN